MINWDLILDTIESEKCVLVLGPEVRQNAEGKLINDELYNLLNFRENPNIIKFYKNDDLFLFPNGMSKTMVYYDIKKFINNVVISDHYSQISKIPFHLIISINNDLFLQRTFKSNNLPYNFSFYNKNQVSANVEPPSKSKPLIYNIMGSIENEESIILDYDDLMDFLFSVLGTKPLPLELKNSLQNASNFIFLGFSFEMKFLQILLKLLNLNMKHKIKFAFNKEHAEGIKTFYTDEFKINFIDGEVGDFINELYSKSDSLGKLRKPEDSSYTLREKIEKLIADNHIKEALLQLKIYFAVHDESEYKVIILLLSRLEALENSIIKGIIDYREAELERNKIRTAAITLIDKIEDK